ncbi:MAG: hypothetical protein KDE26_05760 [Bacteroidetes bacterium]|nr:hypothetical protein [Bacteroidota bacterium]MCB0842758.1 hypothetical protein [Bacteroidota bacterium]
MNQILSHILAFAAYVFLQVTLQEELVLFRVAIPFFFIIFLFTLPFSIPQPVTYLIAFGMGLTIDMFSDHAASGVHAFSALLAIAARGRLAEIISTTNFRNLTDISFKNQTPAWYASYLLPLIFIHHFSYFFLEAFTFQYFFFTLLKIFCSTIYTFLIGYALCYLFYSR